MTLGVTPVPFTLPSRQSAVGGALATPLTSKTNYSYVEHGLQPLGRGWPGGFMSFCILGKNYPKFALIAFTICMMGNYAFCASFSVQNTTKGRVRVLIRFEPTKDHPSGQLGIFPAFNQGETLRFSIGLLNTIECSINNIKPSEEQYTTERIQNTTIKSIKVIWESLNPKYNYDHESCEVQAADIKYGPIKKGQNWNFQVIETTTRTKGFPFNGTLCYVIDKKSESNSAEEATICRVETWKNPDGSYWKPDEK